MSITEEQFFQVIHSAIASHISRDSTISRSDKRLEVAHAAQSVSIDLRKYGLNLPAVWPEDYEENQQ